MKRFREYLNEDFDPAIYNSDGGISIEDPTVVDAINSNLEVATACSYRTPYNSLEEIRKVLAYYKIFLPKSIFLDQTDGNDVFEISQFGEKTGLNNQGEVVTASDSSLFVYFEWSVNEKGMYDTFACICNQEELDDILADFDSEAGDDINEEVMPDLKKKMGAKKVTLPNMMRKEDTEDPRETKEIGNIASGARRKDEKKKWKKWHKEANREATTGMKKGEALGEARLDEISHKLAKKAEHKAAKKYYDAYDSEADAREKHIKNKTSETRKGAEAAKDKRTKAAKRVMKFQQYADKKKLNEENDLFKKSREMIARSKVDRWNKDDTQFKRIAKKVLKTKTEKKNINEVSRATAERAYAAAREKGLAADEISSMLSQAGEKHSPLRDKWQKRANKKWNQARKFADYSDKKNVSEGQLDELKGTSTKGKMIDYTLRATHQLHHSDPYKFDRTGEQAKKITRRMKGMQLAGKKLDRMNKDQ